MQRRAILMTLASALVVRSAEARAGDGDRLAENIFAGTAWADAAVSAGLADPLIVYAVALFESGVIGAPGRVAPYPWMLNFGGVDVRAGSRAEAERALSAVGPQTNVDIGLMQVNWATHHRRAAEPAMLLDPETNIRVGGDILRDALRSSPTDMVLGLGRYHSWNERRARWYGNAVWRVYLSLLSLPARQGGRGA
jgi:soluble lytic murein transglycosylase-like protein